MRLNEIQKKFKDKIMASKKQEDSQEFTGLFETGAVSLENRFSIYQNNVLKSLTDVIAATYPLIEILTGEDFLRSAARLYIKENLPKQGNLNNYGGGFSAFLSSFEPAKTLPYLPDIARMEWAVNEAYYAPDDTVLNVQDLQNIKGGDFEKLGFSLRRSCRFISSNYPLSKIRTFCLKDKKDGLLDISESGSDLLILRTELEVEIKEISESELIFLQEIEQGQVIAQAFETISENDPNVSLTNILQKHFNLGTFSSFAIGR